jgi:hypothetical protein
LTVADERLIRLRYDGVCAGCAEVLEAGVRGWWEGDAKAVRCEVCGPAAPPSPKVMPEFDASLQPDVAGASAQRQFDRLHQGREDETRTHHPHIGGLILAVTTDPQSTTAWAKGAVGEERVGRRLDRLTETGALVLHDRRIPGTRANIDHVVVAPAGVWIIDTKNHSGTVELRDRGGWFRRDERLFVGGRERTKLVGGMTKQVEAVAQALDDATVPIYAVLCFTGADWALFAKPFVVDGVLVTWPRALIKVISQSKGYDVAVTDVVARLATRLPIR